MFREEQVVVMRNIEGMFHQVKVPDDLSSFLRFLWWENCDFNKEIVGYEMTAHVFRGGSSPSYSSFTLRKTSSNNRDEYASDVTRILDRNFYVDDMLDSFQTVTKAKVVMRKVKELCANEGLTFSKFPEDKALGVKWNTIKDTLGFQTKMVENPSTIRGLLSMLSSIYDSLGLGAPFLLKGRLIIQQLCRGRPGWDEPIDEK